MRYSTLGFQPDADGNGLIEDEGVGAQAASRTQSRAMATVFILKETVRVVSWLRKDRIGAPLHV